MPLVMALVFNLLCLRTTVTDQELIATLGVLLHALPAAYPLADITSVPGR